MTLLKVKQAVVTNRQMVLTVGDQLQGIRISIGVIGLQKLKSEGSEKPLKAEISDCSSQYKILFVQWSLLEFHDGILYRKWVPECSKEVPVLQYLVPESLRRQMFELLHCSRTSGHSSCVEFWIVSVEGSIGHVTTGI